MGIVLIMTTYVVTHGNPILMGLAHTIALTIGPQVQSHFSPLIVFLRYSEGNMALSDALQHLIIQCSAVGAVLILKRF